MSEKKSQKRYPVVEVEWLDSNGMNRWYPTAEYEALEPDQCRSVGYLIKSAKTHIVIVQNLGDHSGIADGGMSIPRSAVKKITHLALAGKK